MANVSNSEKQLMIDPDAAALTGAIIAMAHSVRAKVVGEGVESEEQATFLRSRGCEELQCADRKFKLRFRKQVLGRALLILLASIERDRIRRR